MRKFFCTSLFCIFWTFENGTRLVVTLIIKNVQRTLSEYTKMFSWRCKGNTKSHKLPTPKLLCEIQQTRADI